MRISKDIKFMSMHYPGRWHRCSSVSEGTVVSLMAKPMRASLTEAVGSRKDRHVVNKEA